MAKRSRFAERWDAFLSLFERGVNWGLVFVTSGFGGVAAWFASATAWLNDYGPIAWYFAGLLGAFMFIGIYWIWVSASFLNAKRKFTKSRQADASRVNPLETNFQKEQFNLSVFSNPFHEPNRDKHFYGCNIFGPGAFMFIGGSLRNCGFADCDAILIRSDAPIHTATVFVDSSFEKCTFYNLTILVGHLQRTAFEAGMKGIEWRNYPPVPTDREEQNGNREIPESSRSAKNEKD